MGQQPELHSIKASDSICRDFLYFRQLLAKSRSYYDDNIGHRLNEIDINDGRQCRRLAEQIEWAHKDRRAKLEYCKHSLQKQYKETHNTVLEKEVPQYPVLCYA